MKTAPTIEIEASTKAAVLRIAGGLAATALFIAVACHVVPPTDDVLDLMIGGVGSAASLLWTLLAVWRLAALRGPIVTIGPLGIRDRRIAGERSHGARWRASRRARTAAARRWCSGSTPASSDGSPARRGGSRAGRRRSAPRRALRHRARPAHQPRDALCHDARLPRGLARIAARRLGRAGAAIEARAARRPAPGGGTCRCAA